MAKAPDIQVTTATGRQSASKPRSRPFRMVLLGDLAGSATVAPLADRPLLRIDIDNLEQCMRSIGPRLGPQPGIQEPLTFHSLDDFHPDQLCRAHAPLAQLRLLRSELLDPARSAAAIAKLGGAVPGRAAAAANTAASASASSFEQLLGGRPARPGLPGNL